MFLLNKCVSTTWTLINTTVQNSEVSLNLLVWKIGEIAVLHAVYYIWLSMTEKVLFAVFPQRKLKTFWILSTAISLKMELFYRFTKNSEVYVEPFQNSMMEFSCENNYQNSKYMIRILNIFRMLIIFMISCKFSPQTHSSPMHPVSAPCEHPKTKVFWCFQGKGKG